MALNVYQVLTEPLVQDIPAALQLGMESLGLEMTRAQLTSLWGKLAFIHRTLTDDAP